MQERVYSRNLLLLASWTLIKRGIMGSCLGSSIHGSSQRGFSSKKVVKTHMGLRAELIDHESYVSVSQRKCSVNLRVVPYKEDIGRSHRRNQKQYSNSQAKRALSRVLYGRRNQSFKLYAIEFFLLPAGRVAL